AVSPHCYVWADTGIGYTASEKTTAGSAAAEQFEKAYTDYLQPYDFDKYISYEDYSDRMSLIIKIVADGADRSWYYSSNADVTAIYCPVYAADRRTAFGNTYPVISHECQHAMADSAGVIYGLWLNEALSVSIMPNHEDWLYMGSKDEARGQSFVNGWAYTDYGYFDYAQPYEFIRYLNTQANKGVYKNGSCDDNTAYRKFYSYFYTTEVPSNYTKTKKDIYVIEYLMNEYHNADSTVFANDDGSVWTFNDALRYFRIAQMKHESTGKYGFGEDTEQVRKNLPYYTVYTGESGKSVNIYGTGAIMVKTVDGKFEVPAQHGANIEYTAFNAVIPWADGINTVSAPTKKEYNSGDTLDLTGMKIVYSKNGNVTEITDWDGLEAAGLHLYVLDTKNWQKTFTKLTKNTRIGAPYADSSGKENYIILCSETDTIYYTTYQYNYNNFFILDTDGINVAQGSYDTEFVDNQGYYMIYSKSDLDAFIAQIKPGNPDTQKARLYADIEFTADKIDKNYRNANWTTLSRFSGVFDGNGHSISGICVTGSKKCSIFGDLYGKVINLTIKNSCFTDTVTLTYFGGGIADHVESSGLIENCTLGSDVYVNGGHAGGFAGSLDGGKISKCSSDAVITALSDGNAGGICGVVQYGTVENCRFGGILSCTNSTGGIVSYVNHNSGDSYIKNCYSIGTASSNSANAVAAVNASGSMTVSVTNCYYLSGNGTDANAAALTAAQFASGEAAYCLNTESTVWYQNIELTPKDAYPVLDSTHGVVIKTSNGYGNEKTVTTETTTETTTVATTKTTTESTTKTTTTKESTTKTTTTKESTTKTTTTKETTTEKPTETTTHQQTTNADGYDENGFGNNGTCQPADLVNGIYEIGNMGQFYWYANFINSGNEGDAALTADIVFNPGSYAEWEQVYGWTPIGNATDHNKGEHYTNTFDGRGHSVSGLYCRSFGDDEFFFAGLFGCLSEGAAVKNLGVINSYFYSTKGAGAIAGGGSDTVNNGGTISNCYSAYNIINARDNAGGIVGGAWKGTKIQNCFCADCDLTATNSNKSSAFTGPMAGYIAAGNDASASGGKYIGVNMSNNSTKLYGDTSSKEYYQGDSDVDGKTDILDAIAAQKISFVYSIFASYTADMDKDRKITKADAAAILKNIVA
ncbi:MAG: hypothetical protein IJL89_05505, partial [Firmicutes bacterium]|nr:hypothetical protein [Bacillota bacterium]